MNPLAAVAIHRLTVKAQTETRAAAQALPGSLLGADWPAAVGEEWVFIRRLQVRGPARLLAGQLLARTRQCLNQAGLSDEVARFANLTDLLTALLGDLVSGGAGQRWYWRHWAHLFELPVSRALYQLLAKHAPLLPSLSARLASRNQLKAVWLNLAADDCLQLAAELAWRAGASLPAVADLAAIAAEAEREWRHEDLLPRSALRVASLKPPPALAARWEAVLRELGPADGRYQLALLLMAEEMAPLLFQQQPGKVFARLIAYFSPAPGQTAIASSGEESFTRSAPNGAGAGKTPGQAILQGFETRPASQPRDAEMALSPPVPEASAKVPIKPKAILPEQRFDTEAESPIARPIQIRREPNLNLSTASLEPAAASASTSLPPFAEFDRFRTGQGGLLYLLNMLNRPELRALMQQHAEQVPSGWLWLYRLGQELQLREDDPLAEFIACQLGVESPEDLISMPGLPDREQLQFLARSWYGKTGVWGPDLLDLAADVVYSPSHIDLYAPMSAIKLPVRLAGLDINPGWLPWLGRVVSFHYD